jgi:orotidine-5'-phosphate decarboxylase
MQVIKDRLIVALDVDKLDKATQLVDILYPAVKIFKVGSQLFTACGPEAVRMIRHRGGKVFLDLKFHDIPNTVKNAVEAAKKLKVFMLTVHASGGQQMLKTVARIQNRPLIVAVTVLTSQSGKNVHRQVLELAKLAKRCRIDGVVSSCQEAAAIRKKLGRNFIIVTAGIRPKGTESFDQKRIATPKDAIQAGADFIVVGRPIIKAPDPLFAACEILRQMQG